MSWTSRGSIPALLAAATLVPILAVGWLAVRSLRQDSHVNEQRRQASLKYAAGRTVLSLEARLAAIEEELARGRGLRFTANLVEASDTPALLYQPTSISDPRVTAGVFTDAEALEYQRRDLVGAADRYRSLATSRDRAIAAAALVHLGAVLRRLNDRDGALKAYAALERLGSASVDGQPGKLIAHQARCRLYEQAADKEGLQRETIELTRAVYSGDTLLDRPTFALYSELIEAWGGPSPARDEIARTEAALALWRRWRSGELPPRGRRIVPGDGLQLLAVWTTARENQPIARLFTPVEIQEVLAAAWKEEHLAAALYAPDGERVFGADYPDAIVLAPGETRLPFTLRATFGPDWPDEGQLSGHVALIAGLTLTMVLMLAAAYGLYRATAREMALVRQQSDFVSTVSHEFRTPLTSMRHLTDLLSRGGAVDEDRRRKYYGLLSRETERLHHMVESLLSLGRMQAGAYAWKLESIDPADLVASAVEDCRQAGLFGDRPVACEPDDRLPRIRADREAVERAIVNLLENAVKYSDAGAPIRISARRADPNVEISVEDRGAGIPAEEHERLFQRFVRGASARRTRASGLGVGLALVQSVAEAHGGSVRLTSAPGQGSTFTIQLPAVEESLCHAS